MSHRRTTYHHGNLRAVLLTEGIALIAEQGPHALTLRALAARVGVSHTAPKNHFGSLRGLITAIAAEGFRRHTDFMRRGLAPDASRADRLAAAAEGYVAFAEAHPHLFQVMFDSSLCDTADPDLQAAAQASRSLLRDLAEGLIWSAQAPDPDSAATETMLWSVVHGYATLRQLGGGAMLFPPLSRILPAMHYPADIDLAPLPPT